MNATGQAIEIFDVLGKQYGDETFVTDGYGYYEDAVKLVAQAIQKEQNEIYRLKECLRAIVENESEKPPGYAAAMAAKVLSGK